MCQPPKAKSPATSASANVLAVRAPVAETVVSATMGALTELRGPSANATPITAATAPTLRIVSVV